MNISEKNILRKKLRIRRAEMFAHQNWNNKCTKMQTELIESTYWKRAEKVVLYISVKAEPDSTLLLRKAWADKKHVFLPRCRPDAPGEMDLIECSGEDGLIMSSFGIPEPELAPGKYRLTPSEMQDGCSSLVITPAFAFDRYGYRLGYGGGYYDRLFAKISCCTVGLTFDELLFEKLPRGSWDKPVQLICTESGIFSALHELQSYD